MEGIVKQVDSDVIVFLMGTHCDALPYINAYDSLINSGSYIRSSILSAPSLPENRFTIYLPTKIPMH